MGNWCTKSWSDLPGVIRSFGWPVFLNFFFFQYHPLRSRFRQFLSNWPPDPYEILTSQIYYVSLHWGELTFGGSQPMIISIFFAHQESFFSSLENHIASIEKACFRASHFKYCAINFNRSIDWSRISRPQHYWPFGFDDTLLWQVYPARCRRLGGIPGLHPRGQEHPRLSWQQ